MSGYVASREVKLLVAPSGNVCAFPGCDCELVRPATDGNDPLNLGEMAHIYGERPGAARYDANFPKEQLNSHANLIFVCPTHHTEIDQQPAKYPVEMLQGWKAEHERSVRSALSKAMTEIKFAELEVVTQALLGNPMPATTDFALTDPQEKLNRNSLGANVHWLLQLGLSRASVVSHFIQRFSEIDSEFSERLRAGFVNEYRRLRGEGIVGDELFFRLQSFAGRNSNNVLNQAAGLAVLSYLFETCEVFER